MQRSPARALLLGALFVAAALAAFLIVRELTSTESQPPPPDAEPTPGEFASLDDYYAQAVTWQACHTSFECTTLQVPLHYDNPAGGTTQIDVVRLRASDPQGSLLLNPGGPGGSGIDYALAARFVLTREVINAYDIVGFDPRGVGASDPVSCLTGSELDALLAADGTPDSPEEVDAVEQHAEAVGEGCQERSAEIAAAMDTEAAARDMDLIRMAVGDEKLNMLGKSYGTFLAATYAEHFPERVGRLVLDGVLPASLDSDEITLGQAKAFEESLRRFVADCGLHANCPLPDGGVEAGMDRIQQFLAALEDEPIPGLGDRELNEALATSAILYYQYVHPYDWEQLREGLSAAFQGDGSVLLSMLDERTSRNPDGTYADNSNDAFYAVSCLDRPALGGAEHAESLKEPWSQAAPTFGEFFAWGNLPCWEWPFGAGTAQAAGDPQPITAEGAGPILVVSTKYDPATPYEWGVQVAEELASATLLTYDGDGHTAYFQGSTCIDEAVDAYLLEGELPAEGTVCERD